MVVRRLTPLECISIHAPREGGDASRHTQCDIEKLFQSTPPVRGATAE